MYGPVLIAPDTPCTALALTTGRGAGTWPMFHGGQQGHSLEPLREQELSLQKSFPIFQSQENPHQNPFLEDCDECKIVVEVRGYARSSRDESKRPAPEISQSILHWKGSTRIIESISCVNGPCGDQTHNLGAVSTMPRPAEVTRSQWSEGPSAAASTPALGRFGTSGIVFIRFNRLLMSFL